MKIELGMYVTTNIRKEAYYSSYANFPECWFEVGDIGIVKAIYVPSVWRERVYFHCIDFVKNDKLQRVALHTNEITLIKIGVEHEQH